MNSTAGKDRLLKKGTGAPRPASMADLVLYVASSALLKLSLTYTPRESGVPSNARKVGTVKGVYIYPLKSGAGVQVQDKVKCTDYGLQHKGVMDRYPECSYT